MTRIQRAGRKKKKEKNCSGTLCLLQHDVSACSDQSHCGSIKLCQEAGVCSRVEETVEKSEERKKRKEKREREKKGVFIIIVVVVSSRTEKIERERERPKKRVLDRLEKK